MQSRMKDTASYAGRAAASGGLIATKKTDILMHQFPLVAMGGALLAGFAVGMLLPETRKEDQMLGPYRDAMLDEAWASGDALVSRGKQAVQSSAAAAMNEVHKQGLTPQGMKQKAEHVAERAREEAEAAADDEGLSAKGLKRSAMEVAKASKDAAKSELTEDNRPNEGA